MAKQLLSKAKKIAIDFLKKKRTSYTGDQLIKELEGSVDSVLHDKLRKELQNNPKIHYDISTDTYSYKAAFEIHNRQELEKFLQRDDRVNGVVENDLKDCYAQAEEDLRNLEAAKAIFAVNCGVKKSRVVYWNQSHVKFPEVDHELVKLWHSVEIPSHMMDLHSDMRKMNLPTTRTMDFNAYNPHKRKREEDKKKRGPSKKKFRRSNTHLGEEFYQDLAES